MLVENVLGCSLEEKNVSIEVIPECGFAVVTFPNGKGKSLHMTQNIYVY